MSQRVESRLGKRFPKQGGEGFKCFSTSGATKRIGVTPFLKFRDWFSIPNLSITVGQLGIMYPPFFVLPFDRFLHLLCIGGGHCLTVIAPDLCLSCTCCPIGPFIIRSDKRP